jgi:hypothetical protein
MNYNIYLIGLHRDLVIKISSLLHTTFINSDFVVSYTMKVPENPFDPYLYKFLLQTTQKDIDAKLIVDFDNLCEKDEKNFYISYKDVGTIYYNDHKHYWPIVGYLLKKLGDISPGYITGYLLENNLQEELNLFRNFFNT